MGRLRAGAIIGFTAGYVLGAKAGRERYETIMRAWRRVKTSGAFQTVSGKFGAAVGLGFERGRVVAMDRIQKATGAGRRGRTRSESFRHPSEL